VFYTQTRVGIDRRTPSVGMNDSRRKVDYGGRLFKIYKFRTMVANPNTALQVWADQNDKRITRIGKFLRQYRLDELPQLINVLKGDMNVVGPRPEQPKIFLDLHKQIHNYGRRQRVLPGITGWAQINHHYDRNVEDVKRKLAFDLEYIERQTPLHDLRILAQTIPVVLLKRGGW
jgi:lipopolysaccharide/colanic/teichoic acid biosynthesis glycosyltransferase